MRRALLMWEGQPDWKQKARQPGELAPAAQTELVQRLHLLDPGSAMVLLLRVLALPRALLLVLVRLALELLELPLEPALVLQLAQLVRAALAQ